VSGRRVNGDRKPRPKNFIKEWREHRGLAQAEVNRRLGWATGRLYDIESGRTVLTDRLLITLSEVYQCEMGDLYRDPSEVRPIATPRRQGALHDILPILAQIARNAETLRNDLGGRLDALEGELAVARDKVNEAIKESADLHDALQKAAEILFPAAKNDEAPGPGGEPA
jgi:transcriptional regulator with XRE-family HTH domain